MEKILKKSKSIQVKLCFYINEEPFHLKTKKTTDFNVFQNNTETIYRLYHFINQIINNIKYIKMKDAELHNNLEKKEVRNVLAKMLVDAGSSNKQPVFSHQKG